MQYRLNAILDRASDQGVVPHLFSVACLRAHGDHVFVLPGVDVDFHNGEKAEIDLYGLYNGELVAGEVKTSPNEFTESQVARDVKWSSLLEVDRHVMACLEPIPGPIVDLALALARRSHIGLTLVEGSSVRELK